MTFEDVSATFTVYPLNLALKASLALAESDVIQLRVLPDPESGMKDKPDKVVANSGAPASSAPVSESEIILVPSVVIPDWGDAETVDRGGGGLPSARDLGLIASFIAVPNDGIHDAAWSA